MINVVATIKYNVKKMNVGTTSAWLPCRKTHRLIVAHRTETFISVFPLLSSQPYKTQVKPEFKPGLHYGVCCDQITANHPCHLGVGV